MTSTIPKTAVIGPVAASPYAWPFDGSVGTEHVALICIDWQVDFCGPGGYVDRMGYDLSLTRAGLPATAAMIAHARATGLLVIHTREGHAPDLSDRPANACWRAGRRGRARGPPGCGSPACRWPGRERSSRRWRAARRG